LLYLEVSDCRMEEGQLRFEANISLRPADREAAGTRVEIKNLNSFRSVLDCLEYEMRRQRELLSRGEAVQQETRLWDEARAASAAMRSKEEAHDYRYFPEPDLVPLEIDDGWIARVRAEVPELREQRRRRFVEEVGLSEYDAEVLTGDKALADFFQSCLRLGLEAKAAANWLTGEFLRLLRERELTIAQSRLTPRHLGQLLKLIEQGRVSASAGKQIFQQMFDAGEEAEAVVAALGLAQVSDEAELARVCDQVLAEHKDAVASYRKGKSQSLGFLVGQVMRKSGGRANPQLVNRLLKERLEV
jgi:aspartyl-tRNA(Asn)/glutamyl-tRNA(Gln) amidotransferase subunit B